VNQWKRAKTWERTWLQNLVRHKSGRYYARAFAGGKEVWKSLKTSHFSVAEARLAEFLKEHRKRVSNGNGEVSAKMTFGEAAPIHLRNLDDNVRIKPRTRHYWLQRLAALIKSWPGLNETETRKITHTDCKKWACMYAKIVSPTNYNNTVALLRHVLNVAIEAGVIYANPAATLKRAAIRGKLSIVTMPEGETLESAFQRSQSRQPPSKVLLVPNEGLQSLASLCRELQEMFRDQPIMPCQTAIARLFRVSQQTISDWIRALKTLHVLRQNRRSRMLKQQDIISLSETH
jgi:hypothetical protein